MSLNEAIKKVGEAMTMAGASYNKLSIARGAKHNENHDELGRFASGDTISLANKGDIKSSSHARVADKHREEARQAAQNGQTPEAEYHWAASGAHYATHDAQLTSQTSPTKESLAYMHQRAATKHRETARLADDAKLHSAASAHQQLAVKHESARYRA